MWGYACLPRQGRESGRRGTGDHLQARESTGEINNTGREI